MQLAQDTVTPATPQPRTPKTKRLWPQRFLLILSTTLITYNTLTTLLANLAYLPPTLYDRAYDCMTLEGPGAAILYQMFIHFPSALFLATTISLLLGGSLGALNGMLFLTPRDSTTLGALLPGAKTGSLSGLALCTTLLPLPQRLHLLTTATHFFTLYAHGGIHTIQIGCQYGALPLALLHTIYLPTLLLLTLLTIAGTTFLRHITDTTNLPPTNPLKS